jgi:hypothetical protein
LAEFRAHHVARGHGTSSTPRGSGSVGSVFVVASSTVSAPLSWVLDFGASFHVTSDQSQLVACKPIIDGVSIQTADGTSCPITHQGSLYNNYFFVPNVSFVP